MGRRNTGSESTRRSLKTQSLSRSLIQPQSYLVQLGLRIDRQVGSFREVLSQQPVRVFVAASLPGALRITEVHFHICGHREALMLGHLQTAIPLKERRRDAGSFRRCRLSAATTTAVSLLGTLTSAVTRMTFHQVAM
jgi:hypothetical protein